MTAIRGAGLLSKFQAAGTAIDRSGFGRIVEIYPGASLRLWGFDTVGYRSSEAIRERLLADIQAATPWLKLGSHEQLMVDSCDAFDAVIAALAARSAYLGHYQEPNANQLERARIEGWMALPNGAVGDLLGEEE
jgi:predicted nuclease with RNAse H fold